MQEVWKPVKGYEGVYEVSSLGNVASLNYRCTGRRQLLRQGIATVGYPVVLLSFGEKAKMAYVHRLVADTFIPNPDEKPQVNHLDGNKRNNAVSNLEWCSGQENMKHAARTGLVDMGKAWKVSVRKSSKAVLQVDSSGKVIASFPSLSAAGRAVSAGHSTILSCAKGERETAGGYRWKLAGDAV